MFLRRMPGAIIAMTTTVVFLITCSNVSAQQEFQQALSFYQSKNYDRAADHFAAALRNDPNNASAAYYSAYCLYLAGKRVPAVSEFWQLINTLPGRKESTMAREMLRRIDSDYAKHSASAAPPTSVSPTNTVVSSQDLVDGLVQVIRPLGKIPAVTPQFVQSVKQMLLAIPKPFLHFLLVNGAHVRIMSSVIEQDFRRQNTTPRGWDDSTSWKDSPAMCDGKDVVISQYRNDKRTGEYVEITGELGVVRHELGHALDHTLGYFTGTENFKHAYFLDAASLPEELRARLSYFLQSGSAGPSEVFAELCCYKFGGYTDSGRKENCELVHKYFVLSQKELSQRFKDIE